MTKWERFKTDLWIWLNQIDNDSVVAIVLMEMLNQDTESDISVSAAIKAVMDTMYLEVAIHRDDKCLQEMYSELQAEYN